MSGYQRLASASLVAAVALVIAACGPTPGSTTNPTSGPTTNPTSGPTTNPTSGPATNPTSEPSGYPYSPEGVTYNGEAGAVYTFSIPAGAYSLNQQASYDPALDPDGSGECLFGGELDYLSGSGGSIALGDGSVPITAMSPIEGPATEGTYSAGDYRLYIYPETTCSWTIELWR